MTVYLDHAASTPMREVAIDAMRPFLDATYANPAGAHRFARRARKAVDEARDEIAQLIGCDPGEVIFTGGGTEADNATILGGVRMHGGVAVCSAAEHHAVLHCVEHTRGPIVGTTATGSIDLEQLERVLRDQSIDISVVSAMAVNNEVGTITPLRTVASLVREHRPNAILHCDAVQAACWLDLREISPLVDSIALSAHKFGGPKGVGVMTLRAGKSVEPLILGGGQERDRRSGTHNVPGIVATAAALRLTDAERASETARLSVLSRQLEQGIIERVGEATVTVPAEHRVPGVIHLCFSGVESEALLFLLDEANVCASAASACASGAMSPSHVLTAMGMSSSLIRGALRMSIGHTTTQDDIDRAIDAVSNAVLRLRAR